MRGTRGKKLHALKGGGGKHLGDEWLPGARKDAAPVERAVPGPLAHHLRIMSHSGEFLVVFAAHCRLSVVSI